MVNSPNHERVKITSHSTSDSQHLIKVLTLVTRRWANVLKGVVPSIFSCFFQSFQHHLHHLLSPLPCIHKIPSITPNSNSSLPSTHFYHHDVHHHPFQRHLPLPPVALDHLPIPLITSYHVRPPQLPTHLSPSPPLPPPPLPSTYLGPPSLFPHTLFPFPFSLNPQPSTPTTPSPTIYLRSTFLVLVMT